MFSEGDIILSKYRILMPVGVGGMGLVFKARHEELGRNVALKVLRPHLRSDAEMVERFRREARVMASVKSAHVVEVFDVGELADGTPVLVTELLRGCDLRTELAERGAMPIDDAVHYIMQACDGIAAVHQAGYVHRDLKPQNLFLTAGSKGEPLLKILDFGIAKALAGDDGLSTSTHSSFGTPRYMSPEQIRSAKLTDVRTDVWSLGVILFELLTGKLPFQADSAAGWLGAILTDAPTPLRSLRPEASFSLESAVSQALQKEPEARWQSVEEFRRVLRSFGVSSQPNLIESRPRLLRSLPPIVLPVELRAPEVGGLPVASTMPVLRRRAPSLSNDPEAADTAKPSPSPAAPPALDVAPHPGPLHGVRSAKRGIVTALALGAGLAAVWLTSNAVWRPASAEKPAMDRQRASAQGPAPTPAAAPEAIPSRPPAPEQRALPAQVEESPPATPARPLPKRRRLPPAQASSPALAPPEQPAPLESGHPLHL